MRVGLDYRPATVAPQSGIGRQVCALEQALLSDPDTELLRFSEAPLDHPQRETACCPVWGGPLEGLQRPQVRWRFEARFLPKALSEKRVDLYIATANMGLPLGRKPAGQRWVLVLHDLFQLTEKNHHRSQLKALAYRMIDTLSIAWSVCRADRVWCPSQFSASEAGRLFPFARHKIRVLPNLVAPSTALADPQRSADLPPRYWLVVGTREPRKNMPLFLRGWQSARALSVEVPELVLVGYPQDVPEELRDIPGLHWRHGLEDAQLQALYEHAECLWQPSYAEGFGLPVVEALGHGTPVALARGSALDEVAPASSPRFAAHDAADLQRCLLALASQPLPRTPALREWAERYAPAAYRQHLQQLLQELAS
ncbi:MAG: glycosyltransferase family 1 protein [Pseudomonas sp.]|uniref:glycosyltransferase family 4 protein n=1 Tax=Pseudomonas sp. TaxID=306 RepID=UPI0039829F57